MKNWERIRLGIGNEILITAYKEGDKSWDKSIKTLLESNGMLNFYNDNPLSEFPFIFKRLFQTLNDNFYDRTFGEIQESGSKLGTYALFKKEPGLENYLTEVKNVSVRQKVTKFRLSNHRLAIETGRHNGLKIEQRVCSFCQDKIEDEAHFLFQCPTFRHLRQRYLEPIIEHIRGFEFFPTEFKLRAIMSEVKYGTCKFIADGTDLRDYLVSKPRMLD